MSWTINLKQWRKRSPCLTEQLPVDRTLAVVIVTHIWGS